MAEFVVGVAINQAEHLMSKLVDKLFTTVSKELSLLLGVCDEICFIKDELEIMSVFLSKAEERRNSNALAKVWVKQMKELAYVIEDCIDEFSLHMSCQRSKVNLQAARRIAANIQSIKSRVQQVSERRWRYGINEIAISTNREVVAQYDPRLSALFVNESQLVGIDEPVKKIVEWLLDESQLQLSLIGVVGAGGLGKTTIVKRAFEDPQVAGGHFDCHAWITVSQVYHTEGLLRSMIKQLFPSVPEGLDKITERDKLVQMLRDHLKDKRYVIVFDDIWKIDAWKSLKDSILQENELGSRIIITTRNNKVVQYCLSHIPGNIHEQRKLKEEDSWELFCKRVFHGQQTCPEELEDLSKAILEKCDGSSLAIVAIAATLASKPRKTREEWEGFLKHLSSELESNSNLQGVMKILKFSYTNLPYHVQRCLLYLSRFPEGSVINCKRIKRLWMAESLISARRDMSAEEVAESYLNMLVNRSMILPSKITVHGEIRDFTIHDMMMEMIVSISVEENFVSRIWKDSTCLPQDVIRRLSMDSAGRIPDDPSLSLVRSLVLFGDSMSSSLFVSPPFKMLRVLDLDDCQCLDNNDLAGVCQLLHLKYLSLRNTGVTAIPKSIGRLQNLETFDMRGCCGIEIPVEIEKLKRLQFFRGGLLIFPTKLKLWKLTALQELGLLSIEDAKGEKQLQNLCHLRKLHVWFEGYAKRGGYFLDSLKTMTSSLRSLKVGSTDNLNFLKDESTLVESPLLALESLYLEGYLDALPLWVTSLTNLTKLSLENTGLGAYAIEALGTLPNLIQLSLFEGAYEEERLCFSAESFRSLKSLFLVGMNLVAFEIGAMPCLERTLLFKVGLILGIENLIGLKKIELHGCSVGVVNSVKQAVEAHPNHPQLIII